MPSAKLSVPILGTDSFFLCSLMLRIWGDFLEKSCKKPTTVVNRNSQSYARENIVSLNTTSFRNCRLPGSFRFLLHNNADLNVCLKFSTPHDPYRQISFTHCGQQRCLKLINYEKTDHESRTCPGKRQCLRKQNPDALLGRR